MMETTKVLLTLFGLSLATTAPSEDFYLPANAPYPNQGFFYNYQLHPRSTYFFPAPLNNPDFHPELGMTPQYHDLVYNYVKDFAGRHPPPQTQTFQPFIYNVGQVASQGTPGEHISGLNGGNSNLENKQQEPVPENGKEEFVEKPGLKDRFLPSDLLSLPYQPKSQFYGHLDAIKMKRVSPKAQPTSLPPIGGVISNYILTRDHKSPQSFNQVLANLKDSEADLQHIKRQTPDSSDGVVILAEPPQNSKVSDETKEEAEGNKEEEEMDAHPGIAQSKPSAIALAGPGGMAQASPVGTALVGQGGLAVAAPSGTAVAGPAGGSIPIHIGGAEKQRKETTEKTEESDAY